MSLKGNFPLLNYWRAIRLIFGIAVGSNRVERSIIPYEGQSLGSAQRCYWKVDPSWTDDSKRVYYSILNSDRLKVMHLLWTRSQT